MSGVLVLVVLLGMWAFVLVPLVRHRNERADEIRSVARFSSALRVLSRGHGHGGAPGMRQWVMPPRAGIAAAQAARLEVTAHRGSRTPVATVGGAAVRRRWLLFSLAGLVVLLLLGTVLRRSLLPLQLAADVLFLVGLYVCKSLAAAEREKARLARRRAAARRRRDLVATAPGTARVRHERPRVRPAVPIATVPLPSSDGSFVEPTWAYAEPTRDAVPVMTVPLDAPASPRRAAPAAAADAASHGERFVDYGADYATPAQRRSVEAPARLIPPPTWTPASEPRRPVSPPVAEPVVLAEIDVDWEPFIAEPSSGVRLVDLTVSGSQARRTKLFEDPEPIDLGDDSGLEALISRRAAASGW